MTGEQLNEWAALQAKDAGKLAREIITLRKALERIIQWSEAYPLNVFPEPDLKRARELLEAGDMTLDAVSASAMRHVLKGVEEIARAALKDKP